MKVILKGIRPYDFEKDEENDDNYKYYISLLKQVPFPLTTNAKGYYPHTVLLKKYITDPNHPSSAEEWGLDWFDYEETETV